MKKIIFLFLIIFSSVLVVNADSTFYLGEKVTDMYVESIKGSDKHNGAPFLIHRSDGNVVYCINPFKMMSETGTYKSYTYNDPIFNLTDKELNKLNIIGYYGYGYSGHADKKWYGITQYVMWKSLNFDDVYFTDSYYGSRVEKYTNEVNELENLVNNYLKLPSFANNNYDYEPYKYYYLTDDNNVLNNYEIKESNIEAEINNNKLVIRTREIGEYTITFERKSPVSSNYILYNLNDHQELLYPGKINDITFSITIKVIGGNIIIKNMDDKTGVGLANAIFDICRDNTCIRTVTTNEQGIGITSDLPYGRYLIQQYRSAPGYKLKATSHIVEISENNNPIFNFYSTAIKGNLIINKYYGSEGNYKLDENSVFEVYNNNILFKTLKPINGIINESLGYGTYLVKQVSGTKYYNLADEFTVSITEEKKYTYNLYTEMEEELKIIFEEKEQILSEREKELEEEKSNLIKLQNELIEKEIELNKQKEELKSQEQNLEKLEVELKNKQDEIEVKELELRELEDKLKLLSNSLEVEQETLIEFKKQIETKEIELNDLKRELDLLNNNLIEKEDKLNMKQEELKLLEEELIKLKEEQKQLEIKNIKNKEQEIKKEEEKNVLVVKVPNTYKKNYNKIISKILIFIGSIIIICSIKKVTNH